MKKAFALITGASSGIGRALAHEFARHGHHLVLVGRDVEALESLEHELRATYHTETVSLVKDLSTHAAAEFVFSEVSERGLQVDILVNNAGFGVHGKFLETDLGKELQLIQLQIANVVALTKLFLEPMRARKNGAVLNVASVYSFAPVPEQAVYGACKAFMASFTDALAQELRSEGIRFTLLCPGTTDTNFRPRAGVVKKQKKKGTSPVGVAKLGYEGMIAGKAVVVPGLINKLFYVLCYILNGRSRAKLMSRINRVRLKPSTMR